MDSLIGNTLPILTDVKVVLRVSSSEIASSCLVWKEKVDRHSPGWEVSIDEKITKKIHRRCERKKMFHEKLDSQIDALRNEVAWFFVISRKTGYPAFSSEFAF